MPRSRSVLPLVAAVTVAGLVAAGVSSRRHSSHPGDSAPGYTARQRRFGEFAVAGRAITIARPRQEVYAFWRDFSNLAKFMENIVSVEPAGASGRSRWTILAPLGSQVELETEIVEEREGEMISWRSVGGSDIEAEGKVHFRDAPAGRGTEIEAIIAYKPPAGEAGRLIAKLFGREPNIQTRRDLKRLKMLLETGEIADSRFHSNQ